MDPSLPLGQARDSVVWPVKPVSAPLAARKLQDIEADGPARRSFPAEGSEVEESLERQALPTHDFALSPQAERSTLASLMTSEVISISPEASLAELEALLYEHQISGVPVVDPESEELLGVASQADIIRHLCGPGGQPSPDQPATGYHHTLWFDLFATPTPDDRKSTPVREIMTPYVYFATETATIMEALDLMLEHHIHRVVVTRERRLVGVVTSMDLLRSYRRSMTAQPHLSDW